MEMTREEKIKFLIEGWDMLGDPHRADDLDNLTESELDQEVEWLDYLLDK